MKREELYYAIVDGLGGDITPSLKPTRANELRMERYILDSSKGLTEMIKGQSPTVQFIHETVKTYLTTIGIASLAPEFGNSLSGLGHDRLKQLCHSYVSRAEQKLLLFPSDGLKEAMQMPSKGLHSIRKRAMKACPFLFYALNGVVYHAIAAHRAGVPQTATMDTNPDLTCIRLQNFCAKHRIRLLSSTATAAYIFTMQGAHHLLNDALLNAHLSIDTISNIDGERYQSLLGASIDRGDQTAFDMVLGYGASLDSLVKENRSSCRPVNNQPPTNHQPFCGVNFVDHLLNLG